MVTPLQMLLGNMVAHDLWEDAGIVECPRYAATRASVPDAFKGFVTEFL